MRDFGVAGLGPNVGCLGLLSFTFARHFSDSLLPDRQAAANSPAVSGEDPNSLVPTPYSYMGGPNTYHKEFLTWTAYVALCRNTLSCTLPQKRACRALPYIRIGGHSRGYTATQITKP